LRRTFGSRARFDAPAFRVNGKIRAREVRVIGTDNQQIGILSLGDAIRRAQSLGVDLVEIAAKADPPVCRLVDYGRFRYEQSKKEKDSHKPQQANKVKEVQLRATIEPHDFTTKLGHAAEFLQEGMKVKVSLRYRGREMMHQEYGRQVVERFVTDLAGHGVPDAAPHLVGRSLNIMLRPLPRHHRPKSHPAAPETQPHPPAAAAPLAVNPVSP